MPSNIGPKIGVEGESDFRKSIQNINSNLKTLTAETKAVTSAFIGNENSMEALTAKSEVLAKKSEALNTKLDAQKARLKELDDAGVDPTSESYQKLQRDIYNTQAELNKNEAEIQGTKVAMDQMADGADDAGDSAEEMGKKGSEAGKLLKANLASEAIVAGVKALASAIKEGVKALGDMIVESAQAADEINTLAKTTGLSTEEIQKFQYASDLIDVSLDTLTGSMTKLTNNMDAARGGTGAAAAAFERLGVSIVDGNGELRDRNEVFNETINALGEITNATERDAVAMDIFGKSAQDLNPLILGGADALQQLGTQAEETGLILSQDALNDLNSVNDALDIFKATTKGAGNALTAAFAGQASGALATLTGYVQKLVKAFQAQDWGSIGSIIGEVVTEISTKLTEFLPQALDFGLNVVMEITNGILSNLGNIVSSALEVVVTLVQSLSSYLPQLIPVAVDAVLTIVDTLTNPDTLVTLIDGAIAIIMALANGLIASLPKLLAKAPEIVMNLMQAIISAAPSLLQASYDLIVTLGKGIIDNLPLLLKSAGEIISTIVSGCSQLFSRIREIGDNIVKGIWAGISNGYEWIKGKIQGWVGNIVDFFKKILGIASPSKVFAGIGDNMAAGIGVGFERTMDSVERDMMSSVPTQFNTTVNGAGTTSFMGGLGAGVVEEITIPVEVGGVELARVLYKHIVGEGERLGAPAIA